MGIPAELAVRRKLDEVPIMRAEVDPEMRPHYEAALQREPEAGIIERATG